MAPPLNQIGELRFIGFEGFFERPSTELEVVTRSGVDGVGFWDTGERGRPFRIRAFVDLVQWSYVHGALDEMRALIKKDPVPVIWGDSPITDVLYQVLDVQPVHAQRIGASVGGVAFPSGAILITDWTLVPVVKPKEE